MRIQADKPGVYAGQCAEYCGGPHALMGFVVIARQPEAFAAFMAERRSPARSPAPGSEAARGAALFQSAGCDACHRIEGNEENGPAGTDLTYMASRSSIGAGNLPHNRGELKTGTASYRESR